MPNDIQYGNAMRLLIDNNIKSKQTHRRDLKIILEVERDEYLKSLTQLSKKFQNIGFELAPCSANTLAESETFFLVKKADNKQEDPPSSFHEKLIIALTIIFLENKEIILEDFTNILSKIWGNKKAEDLISDMKKLKYIKVEKKEEEYYVTYCWRFYAELPLFDPLEFFEKEE